MKRGALERMYSLLLYAYPPGLRRQHGADMRQCARDELTRRGVAAAPRLIADLVRSVPREWALLMKGIRVSTWIDGQIGRAHV